LDVGVTDWGEFLGTFHAKRAGITELVLRHGPEDPYRWLADAVLTCTVPGDVVLDVGCGSAPLAELLPGRRWLGLDPAAAELALARQRGARTVVLGDAQALPMPGGVVAAVVASMSLQILQPLDRVAAEIARVLRPRGVLVALVPSTRPLTLGDRLRYARLLVALRRPALPYPNGERELVPALRRAGLLPVLDARRRFDHPLEVAGDGVRLVESLYLPGVSPRRVDAARTLAAGWVGHRLGIPLRLLVTRRPPYAGTPNQ